MNKATENLSRKNDKKNTESQQVGPFVSVLLAIFAIASVIYVWSFIF